ncbi:hypothetical protein GGD55_000454 [Rhizobium giardinii]|uniref:Uncharacterized protein n=1 Tax=Rhizobium giardinii TaxID=56731 RepID=A0A7W8X7T8_9HYPH|nr:hypothetical protein [Rhizobium giardinii]
MFANARIAVFHGTRSYCRATKDLCIRPFWRM